MARIFNRDACIPQSKHSVHWRWTAQRITFSFLTVQRHGSYRIKSLEIICLNLKEFRQLIIRDNL
jgi:hypothetical protein